MVLCHNIFTIASQCYKAASDRIRQEKCYAGEGGIHPPEKVQDGGHLAQVTQLVQLEKLENRAILTRDLLLTRLSAA